MLIETVWVSPQYNATHIISIPGNWLIGGDLAVLLTAERHFLLDVQFEPDRFWRSEMWPTRLRSTPN
jgi:hypothetical protein